MKNRKEKKKQGTKITVLGRREKKQGERIKKKECKSKRRTDKSKDEKRK